MEPERQVPYSCRLYKDAIGILSEFLTARGKNCWFKGVCGLGFRCVGLEFRDFGSRGYGFRDQGLGCIGPPGFRVGRSASPTTNSSMGYTYLLRSHYYQPDVVVAVDAAMTATALGATKLRVQGLGLITRVHRGHIGIVEMFISWVAVRGLKLSYHNGYI